MKGPLTSPSLPPSGGGGELPVGTILPTVDPANPATTLGYGTWVSFGSGQTLVGYNGLDADFNPVEKTGGSKTSSHAHGAGTLATDTFAAHDHGAGTLLPSAHAGTAVANHDLTHKHDITTAGLATISAHSGTAVGDHTASQFNHKHDITTSGNATISAHSATTVDAHPSHKHELTKSNLPAHSHTILASVFTHAHTQQIRNTGTAGTAGTQGANTANNVSVGTTDSWTPGTNKTTESEGTASPVYTEVQVTTAGGAMTLTHTVTGPVNHTLGGGTQLADGLSNPSLSHSVTQPSAHTLGGSTQDVAGYSAIAHSVTQPSAHTMGGSTASGGAHNHTVNSGSTASTASSTVQPYIVVYFWKRTL